MLSEVVEVTFKRNRKGFFLNSEELDIYMGNYVIVDVDKGIDLGLVTQIGRLVMLKDMKDEPKLIKHMANTEDMAKMEANRGEEEKAFSIAQEYITR
jgi:cell fate regulator YaaT (PSP1 superfamily)